MSNIYEELDLNSYARTLLRSAVQILVGGLVLTALAVWFVERPRPVATTQLQLVVSSADFPVSADREGTEFASPAYHAAVAKAVRRKLRDTPTPKVSTVKDSPFVGLSIESVSSANARGELTLYVKEYQQRRIPQLNAQLSKTIAEMQAEVTRLESDARASRTDSGFAISRLSDLRLRLARLDRVSQEELVTVLNDPTSPEPRPVSPVLYPVIFVFCALIVAGGLLVVEALRDRVRSANEVRRATGLPVVFETGASAVETQELSRLLAMPVTLTTIDLNDLQSISREVPSVLRVSASRDRRRGVSARILQLQALGMSPVGVALVDVKRVDRGAGPRTVA